MRLVEEKWELDRKYARPWAVYVPAILGLACLVLIVFTPPKLQIVFCVLAFFFLPSVGTVIDRHRFHRVVARLREEGYDVSELETKPRVAVEPRIRVHASSEEQRVDAESATLAEAGASDATSDEARVGRWRR
jgi:hypothetical protein